MFKLKVAADCSTDRYKARLVAEGFSQKFGVDYEYCTAKMAQRISLDIQIQRNNNYLSKRPIKTIINNY